MYKVRTEKETTTDYQTFRYAARKRQNDRKVERQKNIRKNRKKERKRKTSKMDQRSKRNKL